MANAPEQHLGSRVVRDLMTPLYGLGHHVYCDSFLSSPGLFKDLLDNGTYACGTVRSNQTGLPRQLRNVRLRQQGDSFQMKKGEMLITAWKDKQLLHVLSTNSTSQNTSVTRKQKDGSMKEVPCPDVIQSYNKFMSGVDHADQLRASYCTSRKGMKWWKYLFYFLFDICIVNAFILMKESPNHQLKTKSGRHRDLTQLEFRMKLAQGLLEGFTSKRKCSSHAEGESSADQHYPIIMGESVAGCVP